MSSIKSPRLESPSSPIGVSSESGSLAIFKVLRTFSSGMWSFSASCRAHPLMTGLRPRQQKHNPAGEVTSTVALSESCNCAAKADSGHIEA